MTLNLTNSTLTGNQVSGALTSDGLHADASNGTMDVEVGNCTFTNNFASISTSIGGTGTNPDMVFDIHDNPSIVGSGSSAIIVFANANLGSGASISGKIRNNVIGTLGSDKSGSLTGRGIDFGNEGSIPATISITGNTINETYADSIFLIHSVNTTNGGTTNATITGNTLRNFYTLPNASNAFGISVNVTVAPAALHWNCEMSTVPLG
jgi:hypothetical protein